MTLEPSVRDPLVAAIPRLRAFAISLCRNRDQADDFVQGALLQACAKISLFEPGTNMYAWLCTILRNQFYTECRRRRRPFQAIDSLAEIKAAQPEQIAYAEYNEFCAAFAKLAPKQREALMMIAASGLSYEDAAKLCGCPVGTVKSRVNRARAELARMLSIDGPGLFEEDAVFSAVIASGDHAAMVL
jgi:RNA polymerase sigma-70 factor (ECF subfamily)